MPNNTHWTNHTSYLERNFSFDTFMQVIDYINKVAAVAELMNHHPDLLLHDYNQLRIQITTHSTDGLTEKDEALAKMIDSI